MSNSTLKGGGVMKIFAIILILGGIGGILEEQYAVALLLIVLGLYLFNRKKSNKVVKGQPSIVRLNNVYTFKVVGVTKDGRQNVIEKIVRDWKEYNDVYEGLKNKDIKEDDIEVYEVDVYNWGDLQLIPEPENEYDSNAIKIVHEFGQLGYVPSNETKMVKEIMESDYKLNWKVVGGKYKYYDDYEDEIKIESLTYGIEIELRYRVDENEKV